MDLSKQAVSLINSLSLNISRFDTPSWTKLNGDDLKEIAVKMRVYLSLGFIGFSISSLVFAHVHKESLTNFLI